MLSCLADDSWRQLDLAGCSKLYGTELLAAAPRMPHLTALDISGGQVCLHSEAARQQQDMHMHPTCSRLRKAEVAVHTAQAAARAPTQLMCTCARLSMCPCCLTDTPWTL